jgi:hypothetical protein
MMSWQLPASTPQKMTRNPLTALTAMHTGVVFIIAVFSSEGGTKTVEATGVPQKTLCLDDPS